VFLSGLRISGDSSYRNFQNDILSICSGLQRAATGFAWLCDDMFSVFQVQQGPELCVAAYDDVTAVSAVTTIGSALGGELITVKVYRTGTTGSAATADFHVIHKI
jgi:hypothetical protein